MACAPLRILSNDRNKLREAVLAASSVLAIENTVLEVPAARKGTAAVSLTGAYSGPEEATLDVEVIDDTPESRLASAPVFVGAGFGSIDDIAAVGIGAQEITVELKDSGIPTTRASVSFEGVRLVAKPPGAEGNDIHIAIDQSGLAFELTRFSLVADLKAGAGGSTTGLKGGGYDWDTAEIVDNAIPAEAKRVAFADDRGIVYLAYKEFVDREWIYHFVPEIQHDVPAGTRVLFVTGGRTVSMQEGADPPEEYTDIVTVFDILTKIKEESELLSVQGVVAQDRSPTGQAARELLVRTDAHVGVSSGTGSSYATGFVDAFAAPDAGTELVKAKCYAITGKDHPLAHIGAERWKVTGSLSGPLAEAVSGIPYAAEKWGFLIPRKVPDGFGTTRGRFSVTDIRYASRQNGEAKPPICPVSLTLGPDAIDQTVTLTYKRRPTGDCGCDGMPKPRLSKSCLGETGEEGTDMTFSEANRTRLEGLYEWAADLIRGVSAYSVYTTQAPFVSAPYGYQELRRRAREIINNNGSTPPGYLYESLQPGLEMNYIPKTLFEVVADWNATLALINDLPIESPYVGSLRAAAEASWDVAVAEFQGDVDAAGIAQKESVIAFEDLSTGDAVGIFLDNDGVRKARKAVSDMSRYGFVIEDVIAGGSPLVTVDVYFFGNVPGRGMSDGQISYMDSGSPGNWTEDAAQSIVSAGASYMNGRSSGADILIPDRGNHVRNVYLALLSDRYRARMQQVLITGGVDPLGKSSANILESGDGCWRDYGGSYWWEVVGSINGAYAPLFHNHIYYSSRQASTDGRFYASHEFGLQLNIACPELLKEDDQVILSIGDAAWPATYQVGDELILPIYAARDLRLSGGQDGNEVQHWYVAGSVDTVLPVYELDPNAPTPYDSGNGLTFQINKGGLPFVEGDKFRFSIVGGHWRWRVNGGAWDDSSPPLQITQAPQLIYEGLSITFSPGAAPCFVPGDRYSFRLLQPWAASNTRTPGIEPWKWTGADASILWDMGADRELRVLALALHTLPSDAVVRFEGAAALASPWAPDWTEPLTWREGAMFAELEVPRNARYARLVVENATGGSIGWAYAGSALATELSADATFSRSYKFNRAEAGLFQGGRFLGKSVSGEISWQDGALSEADVAKLYTLLDWVKEHDDEPVLIVPNVTRPAEAFLGRIAADDVEFPDLFTYGPNADAARRQSTRLPISGVWR